MIYRVWINYSFQIINPEIRQRQTDNNTYESDFTSFAVYLTFLNYMFLLFNIYLFAIFKVHDKRIFEVLSSFM